MPMLELVQRVRWPFAASAAALLQPPARRPLTDDTFTVRHQRHQMRLISLNFTMPSLSPETPPAGEYLPPPPAALAPLARPLYQVSGQHVSDQT